ncbi:MAG: SDR family oxidoreductase [Planctomycetaceae bacterium]
MPELPLSGRTALVTGGAVRIGRAIALHLAAEGANVAIHHGRSKAQADEVVAELTAMGVNSCAVQADFAEASPSLAATLFDQIESQLGPVAILVNSAAIFEAGTLVSTTPESWDRHFAINLQAPVWLSQQFARRLPADRDGAIVNLIDWRGLRPPPGHLAYTLTKAALVAATRMLAQELGPRIRVNGVAPGAILPAPGDDPKTFEQRGSRNPLQRTGSPEDIADAIVYLVTARFVTGEIVSVTGGEQL